MFQNFLAAVGLVVIIGAVFLFINREPDLCGSDLQARTMAQTFVKRELRDPRSAEFDGTVARARADDACVYDVRGNFRARNGFGGMMAATFSMELHKASGENRWQAIDLTISE